jgi:hypothetical protein
MTRFPRHQIVPASESIDGREHVTVTTPLHAYPGWSIRHNKTTGFYWAVSETAISAGHRTWNGAIAFVKNGGEEL